MQLITPLYLLGLEDSRPSAHILHGRLPRTGGKLQQVFNPLQRILPARDVMKRLPGALIPAINPVRAGILRPYRRCQHILPPIPLHRPVADLSRHRADLHLVPGRRLGIGAAGRRHHHHAVAQRSQNTVLVNFRQIRPVHAPAHRLVGGVGKNPAGEFNLPSPRKVLVNHRFPVPLPERTGRIYLQNRRLIGDHRDVPFILRRVLAVRVYGFPGRYLCRPRSHGLYFPTVQNLQHPGIGRCDGPDAGGILRLYQNLVSADLPLTKHIPIQRQPDIENILLLRFRHPHGNTSGRSPITGRHSDHRLPSLFRRQLPVLGNFQNIRGRRGVAQRFIRLHILHHLGLCLASGRHLLRAGQFDGADIGLPCNCALSAHLMVGLGSERQFCGSPRPLLTEPDFPADQTHPLFHDAPVHRNPLLYDLRFRRPGRPPVTGHMKRLPAVQFSVPRFQFNPTRIPPHLNGYLPRR